MNTGDARQTPPTNLVRLDRILAGIAILAVFYLMGRRLSQVWTYFVDDCFITMRQARNLVEGHGFVYNPGGPVVESYTNHLLFLWQALVLALGGDVALWTSLLGSLGAFAALAGAMLLTYRLAETAGWREQVPLVLLAAGPAWLAATKILSTGATSGLETTLFAGLLTLGTALLLPIATDGQITRGRSAGALLLGLATWTRPEGIVWGFLLCVILGVEILRRGLPRRGMIVLGGTIAAFWIVLTGYRLLVFGHPHPNTYYAKMGGATLSRFYSGLKYVREFAVPNLGFVPLLIGLIGVFLIPAARRSLALGAYLLGMAYLLLVAWQGGDWIPHLRFVAPVAPLLAALMSLGVIAVVMRLPSPRARLAVAAALMLACCAFPRLLKKENQRAMDEVQTRVYGWIDGHAALADWLKQWDESRTAAGQPHMTVMIEDIGLVGWLTRCKIVDLAGLADPEWAHLNYDHAKVIDYPAAQMLTKHNPEVIVLVSLSRPERNMLDIRWETNRAVFLEPLFQQRYANHALFVHKDFPGDGYFIHVFVRRDLKAGAPVAVPPIPRARGGWGVEPVPPYFLSIPHRPAKK